VKARLFIFLLCGVNVLTAQIRWDKLTPVAADDIAMPALRDWQQKIVENHNKQGVIRPEFLAWSELPFPSLKKLFPGLRFFTTSWSERAAPGKEKEAISLALGLEVTLACSPEGKFLNQFFQGGDYVPFGEFLAARKISIRSPEDAQLVWEAFCDLHQRHLKDHPTRKVSETAWHLGGHTIDKVHYYYEVLLDDDRVVKSASLRAHPVDKAPSR
jgi:hypothetical protein